MPPKFGPWTRAMGKAKDGDYALLAAQVMQVAAQGGFLYTVEDAVYDKMIDDTEGWRETFIGLKCMPHFLLFSGRPKLQKVLFLLAKYRSDIDKFTADVRTLAESMS